MIACMEPSLRQGTLKAPYLGFNFLYYTKSTGTPTAVAATRQADKGFVPDRLGKTRRETIFAQMLDKQALRLREANRKLEVYHATTQALAESETWLEAAPKILRAIGVTMNWEVAFSWKLDEDSSSLTPQASWFRDFVDVREAEDE